jgi:hypothetical protein
MREMQHRIPVVATVAYCWNLWQRFCGLNARRQVASRGDLYGLKPSVLAHSGGLNVANHAHWLVQSPTEAFVARRTKKRGAPQALRCPSWTRRWQPHQRDDAAVASFNHERLQDRTAGLR